MEAASEVGARSSSTSPLSTVRTSSASSTAMAACWSPLSIKPCATARHCGPPDGVDLPGPARARLERHQVAHLSDPHPAGSLGARVAGARLPIPVVAIYAGLRFAARQTGGRL